MKTNSVIAVNMNGVNNLAQAQTGARSIQKSSQTLNQARKSMGGISGEPVYIGRDENKTKLYTTVAQFMESVGCPLSAGGQVLLASIKNATADYLKDKEGRLMVCGNIPIRVKIGKKSYRVYVNINGDYKALSWWGPKPVSDTGWNARKIVEMLAQSKFLDETKAAVEKSRAEAKDFGEYYVEDELTGKYVKVDVDFAF